ncbi:MAG: hypothetical protein V4731_14235 [Pseudomonadota bacterium]
MKRGTFIVGSPTQGFQAFETKANVYAPNPASNPVSGPQERSAICSPHFDDAVLSCWSLLDRDHASSVVNVFTGAPGSDFTYWYDQLNGAASSAVAMRQRAEEDRDALAVAGKFPIDLGLLERQYRLRPSRWLHKLLRNAPLLRFPLLRLPFLESALHSIAPPDSNQLADSIVKAVPDATSMWVPAGIGGHADHKLVRQAGVVLAARGYKVRMYADVPYVLRFGWPQWMAAPDGKRSLDRASTYWAGYLDGVLKPQEVTSQAKIIHLTPAERLRKKEAIRRYATQFDSAGAGRMRGWMRREDALAYEVFWELGSVDRKVSRNS